MSTVAQSPFRSKATNTATGDFEMPSSGVHPSVLIALIDLGTHAFVYKGKQLKSRKLFFCWELTAENHQDGSTFVVGCDYPWGEKLSNKNPLRKIMEGWIGRDLREDEEIDYGSFLGQPCQVTLTEALSGNQKKFMEIASVARPMRGLTVPPATRSNFAFSLDEQVSAATDPEIPPWVPRIYGREVNEEIKSSEEWGALPGF